MFPEQKEEQLQIFEEMLAKEPEEFDPYWNMMAVMALGRCLHLAGSVAYIVPARQWMKSMDREDMAITFRMLTMFVRSSRQEDGPTLGKEKLQIIQLGVLRLFAAAGGYGEECGPEIEQFDELNQEIVGRLLEL